MLNKRWVSAGITVLGAIFLLAGCGEKRGQRTNGLDTEEMAGHDGCIVVGYAQVGSESDWSGYSVKIPVVELCYIHDILTRETEFIQEDQDF